MYFLPKNSKIVPLFLLLCHRKTPIFWTKSPKDPCLHQNTLSLEMPEAHVGLRHSHTKQMKTPVEQPRHLVLLLQYITL